MQVENETLITSKVVSESHYALFLQGTGWEIGFQTSPAKKVIVKGEVDRDELVQVLSQTAMPAIMIPVVEAIFGGVEVQDEANQKDNAHHAIKCAKEALSDADGPIKAVREHYGAQSAANKGNAP
jgi:hypothetical protein